MFARKHLLRWLTTAYRQPEPLPNSGACIYPCRHRRLIAHPAPPVELYALAATGKRVDHSNQRGGYRLHVRSRCAPQYLRPVVYIRRIRLPVLLYISPFYKRKPLLKAA